MNRYNVSVKVPVVFQYDVVTLADNPRQAERFARDNIPHLGYLVETLDPLWTEQAEILATPERRS